MKVAKNQVIRAEVLSHSDDTIFEIRESGMAHSPFLLEYRLFSAIKAGNVALVRDAIESYLNHGLVIGSMSSNSITEARYWAVATISTAIHYAILGGLDETKAYALSDRYIRYIDTLTTIPECVEYLKERALELTDAVSMSVLRKEYPAHVNACLHYVQNHLHERLRIEDIASDLNLSRDYLSHLFKEYVGEALHSYILSEKLKEAKALLIQGHDISHISYTLCFSSESHFIHCFKKYYGLSPAVMLENLLRTSDIPQ